MTTLAAPLPNRIRQVPEVKPVETVRTVLRRDIADILRDNIPILAMVPRDKVYDRVMDDPNLLHQGFQLFRSRPELFKDVIMTRDRGVPGADSDILWCGRSLAEIIALVVRACARRYFKRRLAGPKPKPLPLPKVGMWQGETQVQHLVVDKLVVGVDLSPKQFVVDGRGLKATDVQQFPPMWEQIEQVLKQAESKSADGVVRPSRR